MTPIKVAFVICATVFIGTTAHARAIGGLGGLTNSANFIALSSGNVTGGALYSAGANGTGSTEPSGAVGTWLAAGPTEINNGGGNAVLTLGAAVGYVSFEWGSPDTDNMLQVTEANGDTTSFTAADVGLTPGGLGYDGYVHFQAQAGTSITKLTFELRRDQVEAANFTTAVPEPSTYVLMLASLGLIGVVARRRKATQQ
jgi:hypothetical protein